MAKRIKYSEDPDLRAVIGKQINNSKGNNNIGFKLQANYRD